MSPSASGGCGDQAAARGGRAQPPDDAQRLGGPTTLRTGVREVAGDARCGLQLDDRRGHIIDTNGCSCRSAMRSTTTTDSTLRQSVRPACTASRAHQDRDEPEARWTTAGGWVSCALGEERTAEYQVHKVSTRSVTGITTTHRFREAGSHRGRRGLSRHHRGAGHPRETALPA